MSIDAGAPPCCGTFFSEDDFANVESQSFKSAWNNPKFQLARKLFSGRDESEEARALVCHDCPETITRQEYLDHMAAGGDRFDFRGRSSSNDGFNFFFARRPAKLSIQDAISLEPAKSPARSTTEAP